MLSVKDARPRFRQVMNALLVKSRAVRRAVLEQLGTEGRLVIVDAGDHKIAFDPSDRAIGRELLRTGNWHRSSLDHALSVVRPFLPANSVFIDVGANIGTQTLYAMRSNLFAKAIAIEPDPANFAILELNMRLNGLADRVATLQSAAGGETGIGQLHTHPHNYGAHSLVAPAWLAEQPNHKTVETPIRRLDDMVLALGVTPAEVGLVWIDAEGSEPAIFSGMAGLLSHPPALCLEFSRELYGEKGTADFLAELSKSYCGFVPIDHRSEQRPEPIPALVGTTGKRDVLLLPSASASSGQ